MEEVITETTLTTIDIAETELETTTITTADLSNLSEINVYMMNSFFYLGTSFIIACLFWFVCKGLYRLLKMFF